MYECDCRCSSAFPSEDKPTGNDQITCHGREMPYIVDTDFEIDPYVDWGKNIDWFGRIYREGEPRAIEPPVAIPFVAYMERTRQNDELPPPINGNSRVLLLSKEVNDIIQRLEPGMHDAVPVELRYGTPESFTSHEYVAFRVNQMIDAVDTQKSDVEIRTRKTDGVTRWFKKHNVPMVLKSDVIRGKHLWIRHPHLFCSDELHDGLVSHGLDKGWRFEKQQVT